MRRCHACPCVTQFSTAQRLQHLPRTSIYHSTTFFLSSAAERDSLKASLCDIVSVWLSRQYLFPFQSIAGSNTCISGNNGIGPARVVAAHVSAVGCLSAGSPLHHYYMYSSLRGTLFFVNLPLYVFMRYIPLRLGQGKSYRHTTSRLHACIHAYFPQPLTLSRHVTVAHIIEENSI